MDPTVGIWVRQAEHDLETARATLGIGIYDQALISPQQAVEKALKALYIAKFDEAPPRTHDIERLAQAVGIDDCMDPQVFDLTDWYLEGRYPDLAAQPPFEKATEEIAQTTLAQADAAIQVVRREIDATTGSSTP